jgi:hypothetical protein
MPSSLQKCFVRQTYRTHHHHHIAIMDLAPLLTRSGLTHPEVSSLVFLGYFCLLGRSFLWDLPVIEMSPEWVTGTEQGSPVVGLLPLASGQACLGWHFLRSWWNSYGAVTRSTLPRLWEQASTVLTGCNVVVETHALHLWDNGSETRPKNVPVYFVCIS